MRKMKRLAPGIFRRGDGKVFVIAQIWGHRGSREKVLPKGTELEEAVKTRKNLLKELKSPQEPSRSSLTFHDYIEHYRNTAGEHAQTSLVADIDRELGHLAISQIEDAWGVFIERQKQRNRMVWRNVGGELKLVDTGKPISEATIKGYKRYFRAICRNAMSKSTPKAIRLSEDNDPSEGIEVGKAVVRRRPLTPREREKVLETASRLYPWFVPVIQFALTMPVRPGDQCNLRSGMIDEVHGQIEYLPEKTKKTGILAYPLILPHMKEFIMGRVGDTECPFLFYSIEGGKRVQLTYNRLSSAWDVILRETGIENLRFYDLRHDAVSYCLNLGFTTRDVMQFAGWSSASMVDGYDTRDRIRLAERAKALLKSGSPINLSMQVSGTY
jgi:integrase